MAYNPTPKRAESERGKIMPATRYCFSERPRLDTTVAPYLPLGYQMEPHDSYFVILGGKVVALDDRGFYTLAGLKKQLDTLEAEITASIGGNLDLSAANADLATLTRYDATDVAEGVVNANGQTVRLAEPVVASFFNDDGVALVQYNAAAAATSTAIPVGGGSVITRRHNVGSHIGFCPGAMPRAASDVMDRAADENSLHPDAVSGPEALTPYDPTQLRHLAYEHSNRVGVVVADECFLYPLVADRSGVLIEGQAVAIGAVASFPLGSRVTYDANSDIIPATVNLVTSDYSADVDATISGRIEAAIEDYHQSLVGQVVRVSSRFPKALLDKVATRWESTVPGFTAINRMPGSATSGYPSHMHAAGATLGEVQISPLMR